jgi:Ca2+-binding EF-hand superfamily protein
MKTKIMTIVFAAAFPLVALAETTPQTAPSIGNSDREGKHAAKAEEAFKAHDKDSDGKLSLDEFRALDKARMEKMREHRREKLSQNPEFIKNHDTNKDGKIDDTEFKTAMKEKKEIK